MPPFIYFDNNATTQPLPEVIRAVQEGMVRTWGNPSSIHRFGNEAKQQVELAREKVANLVGSVARDVIFTSGGTEGANLALVGSLQAQQGRQVIVTTRIEHSAVRELAQQLAARGVEVIWLPNSGDGVVDTDALRSLLAARAKEIALVSVMAANNETGVIQHWRDMGRLCREHGVRFHCDATQWAGRMPTNLAEEAVDLFSFAPHKFHGPKGVGALIVRQGVRLGSLVVGGPQERKRRGGTEAVPAIMGFGAAAECAREWISDPEHPNAVRRRRDRLEMLLLEGAPNARVNGALVPRIWNTTNIGFPCLEAEAMLLLFSERGICASAGSACSSGSLEASPILRAMDVPPDLAHGSVRFSLSRFTTDEEIEVGAKLILECAARLRASSRALPTAMRS
ncbi:MAG: aminotransferase class V-fold PLP-dependent enzyme [Phycisphaeraceae bacterium]|nr:aminotransferase class V-fold PLP-dependent enzyme [Phycisphaeraceae bacterium]